jgi:hypothetical protein
MNYRDIVLKLLKKRNSITIVEGLILADFSNAPNPKAAFEKWCRHCYIEITRVPGDNHVTLTKIKAIPDD